MEHPPDANGRVEKAAESAILKLAARWMMAAGLPAALAVLAWGGREIVSATNANTLAVVELKGVVAGIRSEVASSATALNSRIDAHAERLKALDDRNAHQDQRIDRQDFRVDALQQQLWRTAPATRGP